MYTMHVPVKTMVAATMAAATMAYAAPAHASQLVGVWQSEVTRVNCATGESQGTFTGLQVYHQGGTLSDTNGTNPASRGPGFGTWRRAGAFGQVYDTEFRFMTFGAGGVFTGWAVITRQITLGGAGWDSATATGRSKIYNTAGQVLVEGCTVDVSRRVD